MSSSWRTDNCENIRSHLKKFTIPQAAALWCQIPPAEVESELQMAREISEGVVRSQNVPCLEERCLVLQEVIDRGELFVCRENDERSIKISSVERVAYKRRRLKIQDLREWMGIAFPNDKPPFLFDEIEQKTHPAITIQAYQSKVAEVEGLQFKLKQAEEQNAATQNRYVELEKELSLQNAKFEKADEPGPRATTSYLNIIGALNQLLLVDHNTTRNQSSIISKILETYPNKPPGLSNRNLEKIFAEAKRHLEGN